MKKILCIVPYTFLPAKTGGQKAIASLYKHLSKYFQIICIGTKINDESFADYKLLKLFSASSLRYLNIFYLFRIKKIIKQEQPAYIQIEHPYLGWLAVWLKRSTGVKLIMRSHNIEGLRFKTVGKWWWKILLNYERWVHRNADYNFFISDADRFYAEKNFALKPQSSFTITFGTDKASPPSIEEKKSAKDFLNNKYGFSSSNILILFNGSFNYKPNQVALKNLTQEIFLLLKKISSKIYKLLICGDVPEHLMFKDEDILYTGFVSEINIYLEGTSIFVNPVVEGGGIKTKLVEALAFDLNCVSFETGAIGIHQEICGEKLIVVEDNNYQNFAKAIVQASSISAKIPPEFYEQFSNEKIAQKVRDIL